MRRNSKLKKLVDENLAEMRIEEALAALRARRGLTQRELAARMGVSQPAIAKLESGRVKNLELRTLLRWATALGANLDIAVRTVRHHPAKVAAG
jgi:transcriptional regulator with XRE-family HTH domain